MKTLRIFTLAFALVLLAACEEQPLQAVGQLESDRIELVAEYAEQIVSIEVREGQLLNTGTVILTQDSSRFDSRLIEARANITRIEALLAEQLSGPRSQTIDAMRANLKAAEIEQEFRTRDFDRLAGLREQNLTSIESVDSAEKMLESAKARIEMVEAQLAELEAGTRQEKMDQTNGLLSQARAQLASLQIDKSRLVLSATVSGIVDSLPFEQGERPRAGDVVAVLLSGEQPYARVYIPEVKRVGIRIGSELPVSVDGLDGTLNGVVRRISSEPSFTPYFALTERDRSRLSYVAEIDLPTLAERLPDGVPVQIVFELEE
ncbi:MAG: HlyD family efflux transporter periplasmic adaptor subunit [Gammaproteobacteria bacterium]|jgi:HlyD family secretion protein|nr:HlyD family efflux transporter periplasmic adaptor subunit [Gammaproteobacteria bacterium]MBT3860263.1 HlyD family efflux transporter periplasmic adaptor subunit [Gammaproteobacteria bacterium]MBT3987555.1 HlyD family efflux transporter periplasmic adaptor subunit [Gammaproteobacteria bacterium]MBT4257115.1 HlyD family efflux transporter periplasmic adaptor subunit [Gammaproteobacteria bacterium]MBT4581707.1 HlyD family efflux transporter periplasmic adaptor subunit [Gammaproteobacteria bact